VAAYTEFTGMGSGTFRRRGMRQVPGHDAATVRVEPTGEVRGFVSAASQGQGHATTLAQVLADELGVDLGAVTIVEGDTERCPHGSGSFASRTMVVSGGALVLAARRVREKIARIAGHMLEAAPEDLAIEGGEVAVRGAPGRKVTVAEVASLAYRPAGGTLPPGEDPALEATQYYDPPPATFSSGSHVAVVEVDADTGRVAVLRHVVVEDCGRIVNPQLADEQIRGGCVQGLGGALYEHCVYDDHGQLQNGTLADYLTPMAGEMPDIVVDHVQTPTRHTALGAKGAGESGTGAAPAVVMGAVNDALRPFGARVTVQPMTPEAVLAALAKARGGRG
jgi:carbon-monoxide dehydrogenase large subunit